MRQNVKKLDIPTKRGTVLDGVLFAAEKADAHGCADFALADTVLIAVTGIHGNFYSNPFYYNIGDTMNAAGMDFIYAQTNDAFGQIETYNVKTGQKEIIGSWNEDFGYTDEDIEGYLNYAEQAGYKHIILAGHSLGANKVIYYLSHCHDPRVEHFVLLSPANIGYLTGVVTEREKEIIRRQVERGDGNKLLPFPLLGWITCIANTAHQWVFDNILDNVHVEKDKDFSAAEKITHTGAMFIGTYDNFTYGDPAGFLKNINDHSPTARENKLIFLERTGHTYQQKEQELADKLRDLIECWRSEAESQAS